MCDLTNPDSGLENRSQHGKQTPVVVEVVEFLGEGETRIVELVGPFSRLGAAVEALRAAGWVPYDWEHEPDAWEPPMRYTSFAAKIRPLSADIVTSWRTASTSGPSAGAETCRQPSASHRHTI